MSEMIGRTAVDALLIVAAIIMMVKEDKFIAFEERLLQAFKRLFKAD